MAKQDETQLVLGFEVSDAWHPILQFPPGKPFERPPIGRFVCVPAHEMARHAVIIAQSGSGKSFFLGRLIEEVILKTSARVLVLDPNSDYRRISDVVAREKWKAVNYSEAQARGTLPTEATFDEFAGEWTAVRKSIHLKGAGDGPNDVAARVNWVDLPIEWLFDDVGSALRTELQHLHRFVAIVADIGLEEDCGDWTALEQLDAVRELCSRCVSKAGAPRTRNAIQEEIATAISQLKPKTTKPKAAAPNKKKRENDLIRAAIHMSFVHLETLQHYFGLAYEKREQRLVEFSAKVLTSPQGTQLQVLDLPSLGTPLDRMLTVSFYVERELAEARERWEKALADTQGKDTRVPTFIVIDEAHNLAFADPKNVAQKRLQELFRTIAAEGRKFGVFLILVTQRPDKIDPLVVSEIENRAIMKIGSDQVLDQAGNLLGLTSAQRELAKMCRIFPQGRALLLGPWASELGDRPYLYTALRRTAEGGKNLDPAFWTRPPLREPIVPAKRPQRIFEA